MATTTDTGIAVDIEPDLMRAYLCVDANLGYSQLEIDPVVELLEKHKVAVTDAVRSNVEKFVSLLRAGQLPGEPYLVAEGTPPEEGQDGCFEWSEELKPEQRDAGSHEAVNFYEQSRIVTVTEGGVIGRIVPPVPTKAGVDVHGNSISPKGKPSEVQLMENVEVGEDGQTVRSKLAGRVKYSDFRLTVYEVLEIASDVDFETGNVDSTTDVNIRGSVQDLFVVRSSKDITVQTHVGAAVLEAGENIVVRGGISGKDKGRITAGGTVSAKFCDAVTVRAGGDAEIIKEVMNSEITTDGRLLLPRGSLIGGWAHGRKGAEVRTLGSDAGVKTILSVGVDPRIRQQVRKLEESIQKHEEAAQKITKAVKPLMAALKRLTPSQRERATELMYEAENLQGRITELTQQKEELIASSKPEGDPVVEVLSQLYAGVTVMVDGLATRFGSERKGHIKIRKRQVENKRELILVDQLSGGVTVLPSFRYRP